MFRVFAFFCTFIGIMLMIGLSTIIPVSIVSGIVWLLFSKAAAITTFLILESVIALVAAVFGLVAAISAD